jgi:hypothetical protein
MDQDTRNELARERCERDRETQCGECARWNEEQKENDSEDSEMTLNSMDRF